MTILNAQSVAAIAKRTQANEFGRIQNYGQSLTKGVAQPPALALQSNLIFGMTSPYSILPQKNELAMLAGKNLFDVTSPDDYASSNYWEEGYAE